MMAKPQRAGTIANMDREACHQLSLEDLRRRAERVAKSAGFANADEAFHCLDAGKLDGTLLEVELNMTRYLLNGAGTPMPGQPAHA